jgi:hypothetical protein
MVPTVSSCQMGGVPVPSDVLKKILMDVKDAKVARVCKAFQAVQNNFFWQNLVKEWKAKGVVFEQGQLTDIKGTIHTIFTEQLESIRAFHAPLIGVHKDQPLDATRYANLHKFVEFFSKCKKYDKAFKLSSEFDPHFDDEQAKSLEYCIQYVEAQFQKFQLEEYELLYAKYREFDPNFQLSSSYDPNNFDSGKADSIAYCNQFMKSRLLNMYGCAWLITPCTLAVLKENLEKDQL